MENKGIVSVVLPIYNQEKFLHRSITSLQKQTYEMIEIVLVNDGSTDESLKIMEEYALKDARIKIVNKKNGGLVDATITGVNNSSGEYICFVDPDDYVGMQFVENFMAQMDREYDFVAMGLYFEKEGVRTPYCLFADKSYSQEELLQYREKYLFEKGTDISNRFFVSRCNKIYRKSCVKQIIREFECCKGVSLGEDSIFTYLLMLYSNSGKTVKEANSYYYNVYNPNSMMNNIDIRSNLQKCKATFEVFKILQSGHGNNNKQSYILYYFLIGSLKGKLRGSSIEKQKELHRILKADPIYVEAKKIMIHSADSLKTKLIISCKSNIPDWIIVNIKNRYLGLKR